MSYLDENGLARLWAKIKAYVADNNGGSSGGGGESVQSGFARANDTISGNAYVDIEVTFSTPFKSTPHVVASFNSSSTSPKIALCEVAVYGITATGFTVRIFNNDTSPRGPYVQWIAAGEI